jgi:glucosyl-3-phosphoglycerate synthase
METAMTIDAVRAGFRVGEVELDLEHRPTGRNVAGFLHRARQLRDFGRAYASRRVA